jgi:hypothetical protein
LCSLNDPLFLPHASYAIIPAQEQIETFAPLIFYADKSLNDVIPDSVRRKGTNWHISVPFRKVW